MADYSVALGWPTQIVWETPWEDLELVALRLIERRAIETGKSYRRALTDEEALEKEATLAWWKRRQEQHGHG